MSEERDSEIQPAYEATEEHAQELLDTEEERMAAAREQAKAENEAAPSAEDVQKLYEAPVITPTLSSDGSFVESVTISRWVVGDGGVPELVETIVEAPQP